MAELGRRGARLPPRRSASSSDSLGIEQVIAVGELARAYGGDWVATRRARPPTRLRAELRPGDVVLVKGSRSVGLEVVAEKLNGLMARVLVAALVAMIIAILGGPTLHRLPAPERVRPAHPRGGAGAPRRQAGHADDGRAPDHRAPRRSPSSRSRDYTLPALTIFGTHARLRRDRLPRRLHQAAPPAFARAARALEDAAAGGITVAVGFAAQHQHLDSRRLRPGRRLRRCRSGRSGTSCSS